MIRSIESIKFLFSIVIVYFHLFYSNIKPYIGTTPLFQELAKATSQSGLIVECFLIIAGYFLYTGLQRKPDKGLSTYVSDRVLRLWPVFAFYVACSCFLSRYSLENIILDLCFLRCTGLSLEFKGIIWYIPPFFWCSLLMFAILKNFSKAKALLLISILTYLAYVTNLNHLNGGLGRHVVHGWLSLGMLRVFGGLGIGVILGAIREKWGVIYIEREKVVFYRDPRFLFLSAVELTTLSFLTWNFLVARIFTNAFTTVIIFSILFLSLLSSGGVVSRILSWKPLAYCGRYCYSIYVMQQVAFWIMARAYWKTHTQIMQQHPGWSIALSLLFSVLVGIATYYLVEAPAVALWKRYKTAHTR